MDEFYPCTNHIIWRYNIIITSISDLALSIIAKGIDYGKIFDVEDTEYRAIVRMSHVDDGWELLSYQHIY